MPTQSQSSSETDDGGFAAHISSRQATPSTLPPSPERVLLPLKKEKKEKKKTKKMEEFDYEVHHSCRAPITFDGQSKMIPNNHPFLEMNTNPAPVSHNNVGISVLPSDQTPTLNLTSNSNPQTNGFYTLTGTVKRGHKSNQIVEVELKLTQAELDQMNKSTNTIDNMTDDTSKCGVRQGPHVSLWTLLFLPFSFLSSLAVCFYVGTMCWYNIYLYLSEEKSVWHRLFLSPLLIIFYPVLIIFTILPVSFYACCKQISWYLASWLKEIRDYDKGFYGWLCNKLGLSECAPYEVIVIGDSMPQEIPLADHTTQSTV